MLTGSVGPEVVNYCGCVEYVVVVAPGADLTGVIPQDRIRAWAAPCVQADAVDIANYGKHGHGRRRHAVGLNQLDVQLDWRIDARVRRQRREHLAVGSLGHSHCAQLLGQAGVRSPIRKRLFDTTVGLAVAGKHLQARPGAYGVVGERQHDPLGVGVIGRFVAGSLAELPSDVDAVGRICRQAVSHRPVPDVLDGGLRRIVFGANKGRERPFPAKGFLIPAEGPHQTVPPGEILATLIPRPCDRLAFLDSRCLSAAI